MSGSGGQRRQLGSVSGGSVDLGRRGALGSSSALRSRRTQAQPAAAGAGNAGGGGMSRGVAAGQLLAASPSHASKSPRGLERRRVGAESDACSGASCCESLRVGARVDAACSFDRRRRAASARFACDAARALAPTPLRARRAPRPSCAPARARAAATGARRRSSCACELARAAAPARRARLARLLARSDRAAPSSRARTLRRSRYFTGSV